MRVSFDGEMFQASHISGPTHNYLGLELAEEDGSRKITVKVHPPIGKCCLNSNISSFDVASWIAEGIEAGNRQAGASFTVTYAEVVENDHPLPQMYAELARQIVLAAHQRASNHCGG